MADSRTVFRLPHNSRTVWADPLFFTRPNACITRITGVGTSKNYIDIGHKRLVNPPLVIMRPSSLGGAA